MFLLLLRGDHRLYLIIYGAGNDLAAKQLHDVLERAVLKARINDALGSHLTDARKRFKLLLGCGVDIEQRATYRANSEALPQARHY